MVRRLLLLFALVACALAGAREAAPVALAAVVAHAEADDHGCDCCDDAEDCCGSGAACPCVHGGPALALEQTTPTASAAPPAALRAWNQRFEASARHRSSPPPTPPPITG